LPLRVVTFPTRTGVGGKVDKIEGKVHNAIGGFRDTLKGK